MFGANPIQPLKRKTTVKHGGGSIMVWVCFAASGTGKLAHIEGIMNSTDYQQILSEMVVAGFCNRTTIQSIPTNQPRFSLRKFGVA